MGALFIMRRPGIMVVSGVVVETDSETVVIENDCYLPVTERYEKRRARLSFPAAKLKNLQLSIGAFVIASCSDDFRVEMLFQGGEVPDEEFDLKGFQIRFNGSFDFDRYGREKEQHVFSGNIMNARSGGAGEKRWTHVTIGWKRKGSDEFRNIVLWGDAPDLENMTGQRAIFVTGERRSQRGFDYYNADCVII